MQTLDELLGESPVFEGLTTRPLELIAGCARNEGFPEGRLISARATRPTPSTSSEGSRRPRRTLRPAGRS